VAVVGMDIGGWGRLNRGAAPWGGPWAGRKGPVPPLFTGCGGGDGVGAHVQWELLGWQFTMRTPVELPFSG